MNNAVDFLERARAARELAAQAERLARKAADPADKARILRHAAGLLETAEALEARAKTAPRPSVH